MNTLVTVIVPTHNDSKYIKETLFSILNQTYKHLEILIIDDYSDDNTIEIVKSIHDKRIKVLVNENNMGAAYTRNRGIKESSGEYIAFLDGDDIWASDKIEKQIKFMKNNNYDFSACYYDFINDEGEKMNKYMTSPALITHKSFLRVDYIGCLTAIYKKSLYPNLEIPVNILKRNDYALWLKISERSDCHVLPLVLASYRKRNNSISSGNKLKLIKHHKVLFCSLYGYGRVKSWLFTMRNIFFYFIKRLVYLKKNKE